MNILKINNDCLFLAKIYRNNKKIYLCRNVTNGEYEFFYEQNKHYVEVDTQCKNQLSNIYKKTFSALSYIFISKKFPELKETIENLHNSAVKKILNNLSPIPTITQEKIQNILNDVTYKHISENIDSQENLGTIMSSNMINKTVYYTDELEFLNEHIITHELLHISTKDIGNDCGFLRHDSKALSSGISLNFEFGIGLNEGATENYASKFTKTKPQGYFLNAHIYECLENLCPTNALKNAFLTHNINSFYDTLMKSFKLNSNEIITKLILQTDALYCAQIKYNGTYNSYNSDVNEEAFMDMKYLTCEIFDTIMDMVINKFNKEKNEKTMSYAFDRLSAKEMFTSYISKTLGNESPNECTIIMKNIMPTLSLKFTAKKYFENPKSRTYFQDYSTLQRFFVNVAKDLFDNGKINDDLNTDIIKTPIFYEALFSSWNVVTDCQKDYKLTSLFVKKIFKAIFNPNNKLLPSEYPLQKELVMRILTNSRCKVYDIANIIPRKLLVTVLNENVEFSNKFFTSNISLYIKLYKDLNNSLKNNISIVKNLLFSLSQTKKQKLASSLFDVYEDTLNTSSWNEIKSFCKKELKDNEINKQLKEHLNKGKLTEL